MRLLRRKSYKLFAPVQGAHQNAHFLPADPAEVAAAVAEAAAARMPLSITGLASKAALGRPVKAARRLDLSRLAGITFYEPEELVFSALAGTPVETIEAMLAATAQELPFEPMSFAALYGTGQGTLGGAIMANVSGPRRIKAGAARDFVLGIKAVSGRGEAFKAGGRVVKNVTGYDLSRGLAGSFGTLAVATEITLKVLPAAETSATLILENLEPARAVEALCAAMGAPVDVSGAAHLPPCRGKNARLCDGGHGRAARRVRAFRRRALGAARNHVEAFRASRAARRAASQTLWRAIRDVAPLAEPPRQNHLESFRGAHQRTKGCFGDRQRARHRDYVRLVGRFGLARTRSLRADAAAGLIRRAIAQQGGGHATLIRAPADMRAEVPVFEPQPAALAALSRRLKDAFDPYGILEPRRMWAEF